MVSVWVGGGGGTVRVAPAERGGVHLGGHLVLRPTSRLPFALPHQPPPCSPLPPSPQDRKAKDNILPKLLGGGDSPGEGATGAQAVAGWRLMPRGRCWGACAPHPTAWATPCMSQPPSHFPYVQTRCSGRS